MGGGGGWGVSSPVQQASALLFTGGSFAPFFVVVVGFFPLTDQASKRASDEMG